MQATLLYVSSPHISTHAPKTSTASVVQATQNKDKRPTTKQKHQKYPSPKDFLAYFIMCKEFLATFTGCVHRCTCIVLCPTIQQAISKSETRREAYERCTDQQGKKIRKEGVCGLCRGINGVAGDEGVFFDYEAMR